MSRLDLDIEGRGEAAVRAVRRLGDGGYLFDVDGVSVSVRPGDPWLVNGRPADIRSARIGQEMHIELGGEVWVVRSRGAGGRASGAAGGDDGVVAPMSGEIVSVAVEVGQPVEAGAELVVLESMKLHMSLASPRAGRVVEVLAGPRQVVSKGELLVRLASEEEGEGDHAAN